MVIYETEFHNTRWLCFTSGKGVPRSRWLWRIYLSRVVMIHGIPRLVTGNVVASHCWCRCATHRRRAPAEVTRQMPLVDTSVHEPSYVYMRADWEVPRRSVTVFCPGRLFSFKAVIVVMVTSIKQSGCCLLPSYCKGRPIRRLIVHHIQLQWTPTREHPTALTAVNRWELWMVLLFLIKIGWWSSRLNDSSGSHCVV